MSNKLWLTFMLLALTVALFCAPVTENQVRRMAQNIALERSGQSLAIASVGLLEEGSNIYVVNLMPSGYVLIAGDDAAQPVLGYNFNVEWTGENFPVQLADMLESWKQQLAYIISNNLQADAAIRSEWARLDVVAGSFQPMRYDRDVSPLITSTWGQGTYYNALCPSGTPVGCVATAMAQIMRYWAYPTTGQGSHSYVHPTYGVQSADFGATTYNWAAMPNYLTSANTAVATISYHAGVSVEMDYHPSGSGAYSTDVPSALINYFKYKNTATYRSKASYSDAAWHTLLQTELNESRPVYYSGYDPSEGGHAWIIDGFQATNHYHVNWGWDGYYNGYFYLTSLNPDIYNFSQSHAAVTGIEPDSPASFLLFENFDSVSIPNMPAGWTLINSNTGTDARPWQSASNIGAYSAPNAATVYYHGTLAKNEWMITPPIAVTSGVNYVIKFWVKAPGYGGVPERLKVHWGTAANVSAMTANPAIYDNPNMFYSVYNEVVINYTATTTGNIYFGWHAYSVADVDYIAVDNISIAADLSIPPDPVTLTYPEHTQEGLNPGGTGFAFTWEPAATGGIPNYYGIYISTDEDPVSNNEFFDETTNTYYNAVTEGGFTFTPYTVYYWCVEAVNDYVTEPVLSSIFRFTTGEAVNTLFYEGFEGATFPPAGWIMTDADGDANNWFLYPIDPHSGTNCAASASWTSTSGALTPDNWLITPQVAIPSTGTYKLEWYSAAQDPAWPEDHYGVYVSTTGTAPADFTLLYQETIADAIWDYRFVSLAAYAGQSIYVAFRHFNCTDWFYMKIDDVQIRDVPPVPEYSFTPGNWNYGDVQLMNPVNKVFQITNTGGGSIAIGAGDVYITGDTGGNFNLIADGLPVVIGAGETYNFTVQFLPLTLGAKSATLNVQDNLASRVLHQYTLNGNCVEEPLSGIYNLTAVQLPDTDAYLSWSTIWGVPGDVGWLHWDNGVSTNSVGAGAAEFAVAAKFPTSVMSEYAGMRLTKLRFALGEAVATYSVRVWTGTDASLAPVTMVANQAVAGLVEGWNEVILTTPITISGTDALYIGYNIVATSGYPAGTDGSPAMPDLGALLYFGGTWDNLSAYGLAGNWSIHGYFDNPARVLTHRTGELLNIPVESEAPAITDLRSNPFTQIETGADRALRGFNVYRDDVQINTALVTAYNYTDPDLAVGTYYYTVEAVHYTGVGPMSNEVELEIVPLSDTYPPVIDFLPLLNSPRDDINHLLYAYIADDDFFNNPIGGANLYYSTDGGTTYSAPIAMTLDEAPYYYAYIPAQSLDTQVYYYVEAWDSLNNYSESAVFAFWVEDPTWLWYDTGGTVYNWFGAAQPFSPIVLFENPFYGTGTAMQLNAVDGVAYDVAAATQVLASLHVYSWDGVGGLADFVDLIGSVPVTFDHQTYEVFDLTTYSIQITTPYFLVAYDLPVNAAFLFDETYDYGTTYVIIDGTLYTMDPGAWVMGANVSASAAALEAPVAVIYLDGGSVALSWDAVTGASSYKVYAADGPYAADPWTLITTTNLLTYTYTGTENYKFFKVVASSDAPPARLVLSGRDGIRNQAPVITAPLQRAAVTNLKINTVPNR